MKSLLTAAALLAVISAPALADETATAPTAPAQTVEAVPAALPTLRPLASPEAAKPVAGAEEAASSPMGSSGCHHEKTVYLTN